MYGSQFGALPGEPLKPLPGKLLEPAVVFRESLPTQDKFALKVPTGCRHWKGCPEFEALLSRRTTHRQVRAGCWQEAQCLTSEPLHWATRVSSRHDWLPPK